MQKPSLSLLLRAEALTLLRKELLLCGLFLGDSSLIRSGLDSSVLLTI